MSVPEISSSHESYPHRCYTPIDDLGDDAMFEKSRLRFEELKKDHYICNI